MPRTFTVLQLRTRVREVADLENDQHWTDSEINSRMSAAYGKYAAKLVKAGLGYFPKSTDQWTTDGVTQTRALPSTHFSTVAVDYKYDATNWWPLDEIDEREIYDYQWPGSYACSYLLDGANLTLYPLPAVGTYRHVYVPAPADLTTDGQTVDGVSGWEQAIVLETAILCQLKDPTADVIALVRERDALDARLDEEAQLRNLHRHKRMVRSPRSRRLDYDGTGRAFDPADWPFWSR